jgi:hypothetical protein
VQGSPADSTVKVTVTVAGVSPVPVTVIVAVWVPTPSPVIGRTVKVEFPPTAILGTESGDAGTNTNGAGDASDVRVTDKAPVTTRPELLMVTVCAAGASAYPRGRASKVIVAGVTSILGSSSFITVKVTLTVRGVRSLPPLTVTVAV